ncbi:hypothetical protein HY772_09630 [Candidatus Woesearchaeota archaeon]|nr:hypothetical protein [Candidatus Woesearchaeota archaeon]
MDDMGYDPASGEIAPYVFNNNNIITRNSWIESFKAGSPVTIGGTTVWLSNTLASHVVSLVFGLVRQPAGSSFNDWGNITLVMEPALYESWLANGALGSGIIPLDREHAVQLTGVNARLDGITLNQGDDLPVFVQFEMNRLANPLEEYLYEYTLYQISEGEEMADMGFNFIVTVTPPDNLLAVITDSSYATCAGACDASATVTAFGGTPPYTYQWGLETESQTTATATGLCEGRYSVTVTDSEGSTAVASVNIIADPALFNYTGETMLTVNTVWNGENFRISDKITVPADITLTIVNSTIEFGSFGSIWVEKGGKLVVDQSMLTGLSGCTNMWGEITVVGADGTPQPDTDPLLTGYPHGFVWVKNNSVIEDARTALFVGDPFYRDTRIGSGGIVWVESGSKIINSYRGVQFKNYKYANRTHFDNCEFICNRYLKHRVYATEGTKDFVFSWGASNLIFNKVKFINTGTFAEDKRGTGFNSVTPLNKGVFRQKHHR